ncbi:MAG: 1-(5-phosphoribosyl)-5-[(5-phosphoribosylamino)methylideneamino]imidazole-4-carboxamide isomerase [Actinomycetota bacterium]|nr:1-(5-phosphoribosyl)-5-[(5-phosphoribosylamino)methylideneamino]imidazole-4-carboxamide isomerase [Actinomycetota bacterium]
MNAPLIFPAIDLRGGRCVRLALGDYERETVYGDDPVAQALAFQAAGAPWVHVVDLDAARSGEPVNRPVVAAIAAALDIPVQAGGGVRSLGDARELFDAGVARVVLGTAAVADPDLVDVIAPHGRVAVGIDVRGREVSVHGWTRDSGLALEQALAAFGDRGAEAFVVTQIERDGTLGGPDLDLYLEVLAATPVPLVASGGVGSPDDLDALAALGVSGRSVAGVIVGKALYEGAIELGDALCRLDSGGGS